MQIRFKSLFFRAVVIILLLTCCVSCKLPTSDERQAISQIANYGIRAQDIPDGWKFTGEDWGESFGGQSHLVSYGMESNKTIDIAHIISIYKDVEQAQAAYLEWEDERLKGSWQKWPGADFVPFDSNDRYRFECVEVFSGIPTCILLQQHKRIVSFVKVNLDGKAMTFDQLNDILKAVDERLNTIELK